MSESEQENSDIESIEEDEMQEMEDLEDEDDLDNPKKKQGDLADEEEDDEDEDEDEDEDDDEGVTQDDSKQVAELQKLQMLDPSILKDKTSSSDNNFKFDSKDSGELTDEENLDEQDDDEYSKFDDEFDEDEDMISMDKMDFDIKEDYLSNYHPEKLYHNYDEVYQLSKVTRNKKSEIVDDLHKTFPILSKYEYSKILGFRAKQLNCGAKPFIMVDDNIIDGYVIAKMELDEKKLPFIIRRPMPNGSSEYWKLSDLEIIL